MIDQIDLRTDFVEHWPSAPATLSSLVNNTIFVCFCFNFLCFHEINGLQDILIVLTILGNLIWLAVTV